jgi:hypothetical protein
MAINIGRCASSKMMAARDSESGGFLQSESRPLLSISAPIIFGTFPITDDREQEMSIFYSFEYLDFESSYFFARHLYKPLGAKSKVIECVFHKPSKRATKSKIASELHAYSLSAGKESMNEPEYAAEGVSHKIGGIAYSCEQCARARDAAANLINTGYIHVLDFGYPDSADCNVKGEWPFHNYHFHLYLRKSGELYEYQALLV